MSLGNSHVFLELLESILLISRRILELLQIDEQELEMQMDSYRNSEIVLALTKIKSNKGRKGVGGI